MKKKIVISVPMESHKAKSKAMKISVAANGVTSVSIGENNRLEVIGEEVDSVCLANSLRKKFCFAEIISIAEFKPPAPAPKPPAPTPAPKPPQPQPLPYCQPLCYETRVYDTASPICSIL